ncbi:MAG: VanZ family protein [Eudoraea sp.]|nr:VanZ family protein [Eudoraea sp.]
MVSFPDDDSTSMIRIPHFDKVVHFFFYFTASVLGCLLGREQTLGRIRRSKVIWMTVTGLIIYGILIEVIQSNYTTYRSGEAMDIVANSIGAIIGSLFIKLLFSNKSQLKWKI